MKKILGIALAVSIAASTAFAQATVSAEYGHTLNIGKWQMYKNDNDGGENPDTIQRYWEQEKGNGASLGINAATDNAGVCLKIDFDSLTKLNKKGIGSAGDLYGWFKINWFKMTGGWFNSRFTNRLTQDKVPQLSWLDTKKLGVSIDKVIGNDADNLTNGKLAAVCDFTIDMDAFKILVKASVFDAAHKKITAWTAGDDLIINTEDDKITIETDKAFDYYGNVYSGFGLGLVFQMDNLAFDLAFKLPTYNTGSVGAWFSMKPLDFLQFVIGGAVGWDKEGGKINKIPYNSAVTFGVDARVRVTPLDALSLTLHFNYSAMMAKDKDGKAIDINYVYDGENLQGIYTVLNVMYKMSDMIGVYGELGFWSPKTKEKGINYMAMGGQVGIQVKPVEQATLAAGIKIIGNIDNIYKEKGLMGFYEDGTATPKVYENVLISIPVTFKVAF